VYYPQDPHRIGSNVVNQNVVLMGNQLAGASDASRSTKSGVVNQTTYLLRKQLIKCQCRTGVVNLNVVVNGSPIIDRLGCPE